MRAKCLEDLPNDLVLLIVREGLFGLHVGGHADGKDHVAVLLAAQSAHDPADRLDNIDLAVPGVQEQDGVEGGNVDAFGEAPSIRQDPAGVGAGVVLEPVEFLVALQDVECAVDVSGFAAQHRLVAVEHAVVVDVLVDDLCEQVGEPLRVLDRPGERDGTLHRFGVASEAAFRTAAFRQAVPAAHDLRGVVEPELVVSIGELCLEGR